MTAEHNGEVAGAMTLGIMLFYSFQTQAVGIVGHGITSKRMTGAKECRVEKATSHIGRPQLRGRNLLFAVATMDFEILLRKCGIVHQVIQHRQELFQVTSQGIEAC